jgi:hypothetical protein
MNRTAEVHAACFADERLSDAHEHRLLFGGCTAMGRATNSRRLPRKLIVREPAVLHRHESPMHGDAFKQDFAVQRAA